MPVARGSTGTWRLAREKPRSGLAKSVPSGW